MSVKTLASPAALEEPNATVALAALRSNGDALAELLDSVFDDLDVLGGEVELRGRLWEEAKRQAAEQAAELQTVRHAEALAKAELTAVRREIEETHDQLVKLPQENNELREHLHALELERRGLETELESLRARTAELADYLAEVKRETAEERAEWSSELKQLRRTLERQAELLANRLIAAEAIDRPTTQPQTVATEPRGSSEPQATSSTENSPAAKDTVLGSVIAQFEMLQRDRQKRRG